MQAAVVVVANIFRRYPNRYESIIGALCENLESLDEPEAKEAMIWIVGEYADSIENADELLSGFLEDFRESEHAVRLQLLTACVKLFLKSPQRGEAQQMVQSVLSMSTECTDDPDLRDRGYIYWRLLSNDPEAAKAIVLGPKPPVEDDTAKLDEATLDLLLSQIGTLASVYHKPPEAFVNEKTLKEEEEETRGGCRARQTTNRHQHHRTVVVGTCWICSTWARRLGGARASQIWRHALVADEGDIFGGDPVVPPSQPSGGDILGARTCGRARGGPFGGSAVRREHAAAGAGAVEEARFRIAAVHSREGLASRLPSTPASSGR